MENNIIRRDFAASGGTPHANAGRKRVVAPIERDGKTFWLRVGAAFQNRDLSWNLYLDAMPYNGGRLQLRDWDEPYERGGRGGPMPGAASLPLPAMGGSSANDDHEPGDAD